MINLNLKSFILFFFVVLQGCGGGSDSESLSEVNYTKLPFTINCDASLGSDELPYCSEVVLRSLEAAVALDAKLPTGPSEARISSPNSGIDWDRETLISVKAPLNYYKPRDTSRNIVVIFLKEIKESSNTIEVSYIVTTASKSLLNPPTGFIIKIPQSKKHVLFIREIHDSITPP